MDAPTLERPMAAKKPAKQSESVRLEIDVLEDARILAVFEKRPVGALLSETLRPLLKARLEAEYARRSKPKR